MVPEVQQLAQTQRERVLAPLHELVIWLDAARCGYELEDARDRGAFCELAGDVHEMHQACWAVLDGRAVAVRSEQEPLERGAITEQLRRIAGNQPTHSNGDFERAFEAIRTRLARRRRALAYPRLRAA